MRLKLNSTWRTIRFLNEYSNRVDTHIKNILGVGKTTLLRRSCELFLQQTQHIPCYGFYTEEVRGHNGLRIGFDVVTLDGNSRATLSRIE